MRTQSQRSGNRLIQVKSRSERANGPRPVRFVVADDHVFLRELIVTFLEDDSHPFRLVAEVATVDAALRTCRQLEVDLLLLNIQLFSIDVGAAINKLRRRNPPLRVLCYSGRVGESEIIPLLKCGVDGLIGHCGDRAEFLEAIKRICRGESYFCAFTSHLLADLATGKYDDGHGNPGLSERETQVLRLIAAGRTSKEIAILLGLSVKTVDTHRRNLMAKTEAHNAADLIRFGHSHDLLALALSET